MGGTINTPHLKRVLKARGWTHDTLTDIWTDTDGVPFALHHNGILQRLSPVQLNEIDPSPQQADQSINPLQ